jgi:hypothetical protein
MILYIQALYIIMALENKETFQNKRVLTRETIIPPKYSLYYPGTLTYRVVFSETKHTVRGMGSGWGGGGGIVRFHTYNCLTYEPTRSYMYRFFCCVPIWIVNGLQLLHSSTKRCCIFCSAVALSRVLSDFSRNNAHFYEPKKRSFGPVLLVPIA